MTTMTMNTSYTMGHYQQPVRTASAVQKLDQLGQALVPGIEWCQEHLLDMVGGLTLAMMPFSTLAWLFVAR